MENGNYLNCAYRRNLSTIPGNLEKLFNDIMSFLGDLYVPYHFSFGICGTHVAFKTVKHFSALALH